MPPPPVPSFNTDYWYMCPNQTKSFWITNSSAVSNLYTHSWQISGSNGYFNTVFSDNLTLSYLNPGSYTITLLRNYSGGSHSNISTISSRVFTVFTSSDPVYCGGGGGPIPRILNDATSEGDPWEMHETLPIAEDDIRFWPNPASGTVRIMMTAAEGSSFSISVIPASHSHSNRTVLKNGNMIGQLEDDMYDVSNLKPGLYIIEIITEKQIVRKRLVIR